MTTADQLIFTFWTALPFLFMREYTAGLLWAVVFHYAIAQDTYDIQLVYLFFMVFFLYSYIQKNLEGMANVSNK